MGRVERGYDMTSTVTSGLLWTLGAISLLLAACTPSAPPTPTSASSPKPSVSPPNPTSSPGAKAAPSPSPAAKPIASPSPAAPTFDERAVADFYRGRTVRIVVGYGAGGGYDTYSRLIGKHLAKYIPGTPTVIVENMPGAGSKLALSQVYNALPKDGTVIGNGDGGFALQQVLNPQEFDFDFAKWQYLGVPSSIQYVVMVKKSAADEAGVKSFADLLQAGGKELIIGSTGPADNLNARIAREVLGARLKIVPGYAGTAAIRLAMDSGEVDGFVNSWDSIKITNMDDVQGGSWLPLLRLTENPIADVPSVPSGLDFATTDEQRQILRYGSYQTQLFQRPYVLAPEVPRDRTVALRSAFEKALKDPEFLAEAERAKLDIAPISGDAIQKLVLDFLTMPDSIKPRLRQLTAQ